MIIQPKVRGFLCTTAHPLGCKANVVRQIKYVQQQPMLATCPKHVLVIGASTGYGLASRIVAGFAARAKTIGVFFEKAATAKRTASPGWYNSAAFEQEAHKAGIYAKSINGDAFSAQIKQQVIELIQQDWGGQLDLIIYSLAAPRRQDSSTGKVYNSVLKPIGVNYHDKTVNIMSGEVYNIEIAPATADEIYHTEKVMGGEDWAHWVTACMDAKILSHAAKTVAYSYIGPEITYPIYRHGTIGKAKEHLAKTALDIDQKLKRYCNGNAWVSVNKSIVTQASAAIPVVPLYMSLLFKVMKLHKTDEDSISQIWRLFYEKLYSSTAVPVDEDNLIRLDDKELQAPIQAEVSKLWQKVTTDNIEQISDIINYRKEFYQLFGFQVADVDYAAESNLDVKVPSILLEHV